MMRNIALWLVVFSFGAAQAQDEAPASSCGDSPYSILISVKNVKVARGEITVDLHGDNPETFLKSGAKLARLRVPAVKGEMQICMPVEKPGIYALALYHDRDGNAKLNKTWIGLPGEPLRRLPRCAGAGRSAET